MGVEGGRSVGARGATPSLCVLTDAPFDAIIVTAAPDHVPAALVEQLKPGGRMVIPVGGAREQALMLITKNPDGTTTTTNTVPVIFVPHVKGG